MSMADIFDKNAAEHPDKPCFLYQDEVWSYAKVNFPVSLILRFIVIMFF